MVTYTTNHGFGLFADDEKPWEHREDLKSLDTDVPIHDVEANLSTKTPKAGAEFVATDTGAEYIGDGTNWLPKDVVLGSVTAERANISDATTGDRIDINPGATYDVTRVGDNYHVYDGSEIVHTSQGAHTFHTVLKWIADQQSLAAEPYVVRIDDGVYSFGNSCDFTGTPSFKLVGSRRTVFSCDPTGLFDATAGNYQFYTANASNVVIENITWDNNGSGARTPLFLTPGGTSRVRIRDCDFTGAYSGEGIIYVQNANRVEISGCHIYGVNQDIRGIAFRTNPATYLTIHDNIIEDIGWNGISIYGDSKYVSVVGNIVQNTDHSAIACSPGKRATIVGNVVDNIHSVAGSYEGGIELEYKHVTGQTTAEVTVGFNVVNNCEKGIFVTDRIVDLNSITPHTLNIAYNTVTNCGEGLLLEYADPPCNVDRNLFSTNTTDMNIAANATDVSIRGDYDLGTRTITNNGTRTRWNGWIGGGPLGGVDLSTTTGQFEGDMAVANGTSVASKYARAVWDSVGAQWHYVNPTGVV